MKSLVLRLVAAAVLAGGIRPVAEESSGGEFTLSGGIGAGGGASSGGGFSVTGGAAVQGEGLLSGGGYSLEGGLVGFAIEPTEGGEAVLRIERVDSSQALLTWSEPGYLLEVRDGLSEPAAWVPVDPQPEPRAFSVPIQTPAKFFRLRKQ